MYCAQALSFPLWRSAALSLTLSLLSLSLARAFFLSRARSLSHVCIDARSLSHVCIDMLGICRVVACCVFVARGMGGVEEASATKIVQQLGATKTSTSLCSNKS